MFFTYPSKIIFYKILFFKSHIKIFIWYALFNLLSLLWNIHTIPLNLGNSLWLASIMECDHHKATFFVKCYLKKRQIYIWVVFLGHMVNLFVIFLVTTTVISTLGVPIFTLSKWKFPLFYTHGRTCFHDLSYLDLGKMKSQSRCYLHFQYY